MDLIRVERHLDSIARSLKEISKSLPILITTISSTKLSMDLENNPPLMDIDTPICLCTYDSGKRQEYNPCCPIHTSTTGRMLDID